MMSRIINRLIVFGFRLRHALRAGYYKGHGIHSPAVYEFVEKVLFGKANSGSIPEGLFTGNQAQVRKTFPDKYLKVLYRMVQFYQPAIVVDLNESACQVSNALSADINRITLYRLINKSLCVVPEMGLQNTNTALKRLVPDGISNSGFPLIPSADLVFLPCSNNPEKIISHLAFADSKVEKGFIVMEGIYRTNAMRKAWQKAVASQLVSIDLFELGIVLKGELLTPGHYRIRF